jgi:hypothetical protein
VQLYRTRYQKSTQSGISVSAQAWAFKTLSGVKLRPWIEARWEDTPQRWKYELSQNLRRDLVTLKPATQCNENATMKDNKKPTNCTGTTLLPVASTRKTNRKPKE